MVPLLECPVFGSPLYNLVNFAIGTVKVNKKCPTSRCFFIDRRLIIFAVFKNRFVLVLLLFLNFTKHLNYWLRSGIRYPAVSSCPVVPGMNCTNTVEQQHTDEQTENHFRPRHGPRHFWSQNFHNTRRFFFRRTQFKYVSHSHSYL